MGRNPSLGSKLHPIDEDFARLGLLAGVQSKRASPLALVLAIVRTIPDERLQA